MTHTIQRALIPASFSSLFPESVVTAEMKVVPVMINCIYPTERTFIQAAHNRRQYEFIAGRLGARAALEGFGITNFPILIGNGGAPCWPQGIVGSISHTKTNCGICIARRSSVRGLGLDIEDVVPMDSTMLRQILTEIEYNWLMSQPSFQHIRLACTLFSAKECYYKCQYPITRSWLNFHDITVSLNIRASCFSINVLNKDSKPPGINRPLGHFSYQDNTVFTALTLKG